MLSAVNFQIDPLRVLFVVPYVPSQIRVRPFQLLRGLAQRGHAVTLLCPVGSEGERQDLEALRPFCEQVVTLSQGRLAALESCLRALPRGLPFQAAISSTPALQQLVKRTIAEGHFDVVHVEHLRGAELGRAALEAGVPVVFDAVDCISLLFERALRGSRSLSARVRALIDLARARRYEAGYQGRFSQILVTSREDRWALETLRHEFDLPGDGIVTTIPNGVDLEYFAPQHAQRDPSTLVLTGKMSYHANHAAALYLAQEIMPLVWREQPEVRLELVGAQPGPALQALSADQRVVVTGQVPDLRPYLARATLAVCSLRYGVGVQNKVLEAMAMATPVIASRRATVALDAQPGRDLLVAANAHEFAAQILALLADERRRALIGTDGRSYVERHHSWGGAIDRLERCYRNGIAACSIG